MQIFILLCLTHHDFSTMYMAQMVTTLCTDHDSLHVTKLPLELSLLLLTVSYYLFVVK